MNSIALAATFNFESKKIIRDLLGRVETIENIGQSENGFTEACRAFGIENIAYLGANLPQSNYQNFYVQSTYSLPWQQRYEAANHATLDPVIQYGLKAALPFDWRSIPTLTKSQVHFLDEAKEFGVGNQGLTFPVHGIGGELGFFCIAATMNARDWLDFKRQNYHNLRLMADMFHQKLIASMLPTTTTQKPLLTPREVECLKWCAEGKTQQDIAEIIGISPRTVRFFLETARIKLNCLNTTHTVITAITHGLICP